MQRAARWTGGPKEQLPKADVPHMTTLRTFAAQEFQAQQDTLAQVIRKSGQVNLDRIARLSDGLLKYRKHGRE